MQKVLLVLMAVLCIAILFGQDEIEKLTDYVQHEIEKIVHGSKVFDNNKSIESSEEGGQKNIKPDDGSDLYIKGSLQARLGNYEEALTYFNKAVEVDPKNAWAYYDRGLVKIKLGDKDGACSDLHKAGELGYFAEELIQKHCNTDK